MKSTKTGECIVDRLNGALSAMRKERDELHRQKDLALERLKLMREERVSVEKVVQSLRKELEQLMIETSEEGKKSEDESIETLIKEVNRLSKEACFQHQELVSKKELLTQLDNRIAQDHMARNIQLQKTILSIRRKREKTFEDMKQDTSLDETHRVDAFRRASKSLCNDESFRVNLPRLIQTKISDIGKETIGVNERCYSLQKKIEGYTHLFADLERRNKDMMEQ